MEVKKGYKQTELGVFPEDWVPLKLGNCSLILRGGSPRPIENYLTTASDGVNWIKIGDVKPNDKYITSTEEKITFEGLSRSREVNPGDFLLSNSMSFGRPYILKINGCIHDGWLVIKDYKKHFDRDFLYYSLGSEAIYNQYRSMASGSSVLNLNKEVVKEVVLFCPKSLHEQTAIATALSDMDALIAQTEKLIEKKKAMKQGMMQELLKPKKGWVTKKLNEIADIDTENLSISTNPDYIFKYISLEDVDLGKLRSMTEFKFRNAPSRARRVVRKYDILVSTVRPNLKSHLIIKEDVTDWICSTGFSVLRTRASANSEFIFSCFFSSIINNQIDKLIAGSNYPSISSMDIKSLQISLPPLPEQEAIAKVLSDMDDSIYQSETRLIKMNATKQGMMQELLTGRIRLL